MSRRAFSSPRLPTQTAAASRRVKPTIQASAFSSRLALSSQVPVFPAVSQPLLRFAELTLLSAYVRSFSASGLRIRSWFPAGSVSE